MSRTDRGGVEGTGRGPRASPPALPPPGEVGVPCPLCVRVPVPPPSLRCAPALDWGVVCVPPPHVPGAETPVCPPPRRRPPCPPPRVALALKYSGRRIWGTPQDRWCHPKATKAPRGGGIGVPLGTLSSSHQHAPHCTADFFGGGIIHPGTARRRDRTRDALRSSGRGGGGGLSLHPLPAHPSRLMGFRWSLGAEILKIVQLFLMSWEKSHLGPGAAGERAPVKGLHRGPGVYWGGNGARGTWGARAHICTAAAPSSTFTRSPGPRTCLCSPPKLGNPPELGTPRHQGSLWH